MRCLLVDDNAAFVETARRVLDPDGAALKMLARRSSTPVTLDIRT